MDSKALASLCRDLAENRKAENVVVLDLRKVSSVTDYFVVATGSSEPHLRAILDEVERTLREQHDLRPRAIDGSLSDSWLVLDYFDVIVHIMRPETRTRYDLEGLWGDAPKVSTKVPKKASKPKAVRALLPVSGSKAKVKRATVKRAIVKRATRRK